MAKKGRREPSRPQGPGKRPQKVSKSKKRSHPVLTHGLAVVVFAILSIIFWRKILFPGHLVYATDQITAGLVFRQFETWAFRTFHQFPLWDPYIFSGIPFLAGQHADLFYPTSLLRLIFPPYLILNWNFIIHTFLAGLFMYIFLLSLGLKRVTSFVVGVSYMFAGTITSLAYSGHDSKVIIASLLPAFFWTLFRAAETGKLFWFILGGIFLSLGIFASHLQMMYFAYLALGIAFLYLLWYVRYKTHDTKRVLKFFSFSILALILSVLIGFVQYFPALDYIRHFSPRGVGGKTYQYAISWSLPPVDLISAFFAKFSGFLNTYWGQNPFKINSEYIGALPLPFAIWAIVKNWKSPHVKFFSVLSLIYILIALGGYTPFYKLVYYLLPGVKNFRASAMTFYVVAFSINVLAAYGLDIIDKKSIKEFVRFAVIFALISLFIALLTLLMKGSLSSIVSPEKLDAFRRYYGQVPLSFIRTGVFVLLALGLLTLYLRERPISQILFSFGMALIIIVDLWSIHSNFVKSIPPPSEFYAPDRAVNFLRGDKDIYRVLPLFYRIDEDYLMVHHIESAGGHHPFPPQSYIDYIGTGGSVMFRPYAIKNLMAHRKLVDLLNAKYIITQPIPEDLSRYRKDIQEMLRPISNFLKEPGITPVARTDSFVIYKDDSVMPRATLLSNYKVLTYDESLNYMLSDEFDPGKLVLLEEDPKLGEKRGSQGTVKIIKRTPNSTLFETSTDGDMILLYTDNYYDRWRAKLDEKTSLPVIRADHTFRAIPVPGGNHKILLYYDGSVAKKSALLSFLFFILGIIGLVITGKNIRKR